MVGEFKMKINGAWYIDTMPTMIVTELESGDLKMFYLNPFKEIKESDLKDYKGYHPRKLKGQPLPTYLYKFYGLEKNEESLSETVRVRLSPSQLEKIEAYAKNNNKNVSETLRDYINSL